MKTFFIKVYGCQYNEWDATRLAFALSRLGLKEVDEKEAEIIFAMNCSVRKTGVDRAMGKIKNWQGKKIIIAGCILPTDAPKFVTKSAILWNGENFGELARILDLKITDTELSEIFREGQKKSNYIPITKGCNNFCSYCAVPYTRGREISRSMADILEDVKKVIREGYKDIWLLGQNVNSYIEEKKEVRSKNIGKTDFSILLEKINDLDGEFLIYFTSNHPKDMSDDIIKTIAGCDKVAKIIHLPLQSGSNKILKAMNRPYTKEQYLKLVDKIKLQIPGVKITSDTIIGFPGETEEDFQETINVLKEVKYFQVFNNKYSPREGTAAFKFGDPITWAEKERRWRILNDIANAKK